MSISVLDSLSPPQKEATIRLPFRVGMWISQADQTGGSESDAKERQVLGTIVASYAEDYLKSEFVQRLMELTLRRRTEWDHWTASIEKVPLECKAVLKALAQHLPAKDVETLKHNLMDIAFAVAMAYHEGPSPTRSGPIGSFLENLGGFLGRVLGTRAEMIDENISADEHRALLKLAEAMDLDLKARVRGE